MEDVLIKTHDMRPTEIPAASVGGQQTYVLMLGTGH